MVRAAESFRALDAGPRIRELNALADETVEDALRRAPSAAALEAAARKAAKRATHAPMMRLRAGEVVAIDVVVEDVRAAVADVVGGA